MLKRINYKVQTSCESCKFSFRAYEYDDHGELYCNLNNDRPKCGSYAMHESFSFDVEDENDKNDIKTWYKWEKTHQVNSSGICDKFQPKNN